MLDNPANLFEDDLDLIRGNCSNCGNHDKVFQLFNTFLLSSMHTELGSFFSL